jgi:hypothetical protein
LFGSVQKTSLAREDDDVSQRFYNHMTAPRAVIQQTNSLFGSVQKNLKADLDKEAKEQQDTRKNKTKNDSTAELQSMNFKKPKVQLLQKFTGAHLDHNFFSPRDTNSEQQDCGDGNSVDFAQTESLSDDDVFTSQEQRELHLRAWEDSFETADFGRLDKRTLEGKLKQREGKLKQRSPMLLPRVDDDSESRSRASESGSGGFRRSKRVNNLTIQKQRQKESQEAEEVAAAEAAALVRKQNEKDAETERKLKLKKEGQKQKQRKQEQKEAAVRLKQLQDESRRNCKKEEKTAEAKRKREEKEGQEEKEREKEREKKRETRRKQEEKEREARRKQEEKESNAQRKQDEAEAEVRRKQDEAEAEVRRKKAKKEADDVQQNQEEERTKHSKVLEDIQDSLKSMVKQNEQKQFKELEERLKSAIKEIQPQASQAQTDSGKATELMSELTKYSSSLLSSVSSITNPAFSAFGAMTSSIALNMGSGGFNLAAAAAKSVDEEAGHKLKEKPVAVLCIDDFAQVEMTQWTPSHVQRWLDFHNLSVLCNAARQNSLDGVALKLLSDATHRNSDPGPFDTLANEIWSTVGRFPLLRLNQVLTMWHAKA